KLEDTSRRALDEQNSYAERTKLLLQLRVALTQLNNEARAKMEAAARRELRPPFDLPLDTARNHVNDLLRLVDHMPLTENPDWRKMRDDLAKYVEVTRDKDRYSQEGFASFRDVDTELNTIIDKSASEPQQIVAKAAATQAAAARTIRLWNLI